MENSVNNAVKLGIGKFFLVGLRPPVALRLCGVS